MAPKGPLVLLLALATLTAGCIQAGEELEPDAAELPEQTPDPGIHEWSSTEKEAGTFERMVQATEETRAIAVGYWADTGDFDGRVEISLYAPGRGEVPISRTIAGEEDGYAFIDAQPGNYTLVAAYEGETTGGLLLEAIDEEQGLSAVEGTGHERVVIAVVDTGINPYHDVFRDANLSTSALPPSILDATTGQPPIAAPTTPAASYDLSIALDASTWTMLPSQCLVHFEGTNVLGYHLDETELPALPVLDRAGHGTMVAHSIVRENPDALVVMITGDDYDAGVRWAASQPWIDMISLSWGPAVNAAGAAEPILSGFVTPEATRKAHDNGKLVFTATGNDPTLAFTDTTSGPAWVHAVSGAQPDTRARATMSGNLVDTVANWTQTLATYDSLDETRTGSGTSFATPTTAGIAARILHEVRQAGGEAEASELRDALNRTAVYWDTTDYGGPSDPGPSLPVAPGPWASMGWGYLDGSAVPTAVAGLLGEQPLPDKPSEAEAFMGASLALRQAWWPR